MTTASPSGVLAVDKPVGPTSHDVVAQARRALRTRKIGHTGTLDPFASGLMLLCVGAATRLSPFLTHLDKRYVAEAVLGITTDTHDSEGSVVAEAQGGDALDAARIESALARFRGVIEQVPPVYSAKKVRGEPAHRRVRRGEVVELPPKQVTVHALELVDYEGERLRFEVHCSSGTYIRALARDIGEVLGVGAHLTSLRRLSVGTFDVSTACSTDRIGDAPDTSWMSPAEALRRAGVPDFEVDEAAEKRLVHGRDIETPGLWADDPVEAVAVIREGRLLAVGRTQDGVFLPRRVFVRAT